MALPRARREEHPVSPPRATASTLSREPVSVKRKTPMWTKNPPTWPLALHRSPGWSMWLVLLAPHPEEHPLDSLAAIPNAYSLPFTSVCNSSQAAFLVCLSYFH